MGRTAVPVIYEKDRIVAFQDLLRKWEASIDTYDAAVAAHASPGPSPEHAAERQAAEERALAELSEIKAQIGQLVAETRQSRRKYRAMRFLTSLRLSLPRKLFGTNPQPKPRTLSRT
jgi:hypothetical protein